jgi:hypothetical protein
LLGTFGDDAFHALAVLAGGLLFQVLEYLLQPLHLSFRFFEVAGEKSFQVLARGAFRHLRQRLDQLIFSAVQVPQFIH